MRFTTAEDSEATSLCAELICRAMETDAPGLRTANVWLWVVEPPGPDARAVVPALFDHPGLPHRELLEPHAAAAPWISLPPEAARSAAVRLLTSGASMEVAAYQDETEAAERFADRLLAWVGHPAAVFANMEWRTDGSGGGFGVFRVPHWIDEGLVLVGATRVGVLWFVGTD